MANVFFLGFWVPIISITIKPKKYILFFSQGSLNSIVKEFSFLILQAGETPVVGGLARASQEETPSAPNGPQQPPSSRRVWD